MGAAVDRIDPPARGPAVFSFAERSVRGETVRLGGDLWRPAQSAPADLVVWLYNGWMRGHTRQQRPHNLMAPAFTARGYAFAVPDYRPFRPRPALSPAFAERAEALAAEAIADNTGLRQPLLTARTLALVEDVCDVLNHLHDRREELNLSGRIMLAGGGLGALVALNTLFLSEALNLRRPDIQTLVACSPAFANYSRIRTTGARIYLQSSPDDVRFPIALARRLKWTMLRNSLDPCLQVEHPEQPHGSIRLMPRERIADAVARVAEFDRAADPLAIGVAVPGAVVVR